MFEEKTITAEKSQILEGHLKPPLNQIGTEEETMNECSIAVLVNPQMSAENSSVGVVERQWIWKENA